MFRRFIIGLILTSMFLHCCSRIGLFSYLYQQRHEIAEAIGVITQAPIALCSGDYHTETDLVVQESPSDHSLPPSFLQAREINLFFEYQTGDTPTGGMYLVCENLGNTPYHLREYALHAHELMQPPRG